LSPSHLPWLHPAQTQQGAATTFAFFFLHFHLHISPPPPSSSCTGSVYRFVLLGLFTAFSVNCNSCLSPDLPVLSADLRRLRSRSSLTTNTIPTPDRRPNNPAPRPRLTCYTPRRITQLFDFSTGCAQAHSPDRWPSDCQHNVDSISKTGG